MKMLEKIKPMAISVIMVMLFMTQAMAQENKKVERAEAKFCKSVNNFKNALVTLDEANAGYSVDDFNKAYNKAIKAYNKLEKSAANLEKVEIKESVKAYNKLVESVNKIESDTKTTENTELINQNIDATAAEIADIVTVFCK